MTLVRRDFRSGTLYLGGVGDVAPLLHSGSIDLVLTDPPYCSGGGPLAKRQESPAIKYQNSGTRKAYPDFPGDQLDQRAFMSWCADWGRESCRLLRKGGLHLQFSDWRQLPATVDAVQRAGIIWRGIIPWDKTEMARPMLGGFRAHAEFIVWGTNGRLIRSNGIGCLPGAYRVPIHHNEKLHLTAKPLALTSKLMEACKPGGCVADWFMGSGTTAVAAVATGRRFIGCELSPEYFDIACRRIEVAELHHS